MKVLHVYRTYFPDPPGGVQEAIRQITGASKLHGINSRIFTLSPNPSPRQIEKNECVITRSRSWLAPASCDIGGFDALARFRSEVDWADLINYHFPWPFADVLHFMSLVNKPAVLTYHSDIVRQRLLGKFYEPLMRRMLRSMAAVVATSPAYAQTSKVLQNFVSPERLKIIPLGITDYRDKSIDADLENKLFDKFSLRDKPFVLALGAMRYYKGFHTLVEAASRINGTIIIAGSGPEEIHLRKLATDKGVNNVLFVGQISDDEKLFFLKNCSIFALPSHLRSEAFGMVLIEASMFGKPMVCCEIGSGTSYVNIHNQTGFVVLPESPDLFAEAVNLLISSEELACKMGMSARRRFEEFFSGEALGAAYSMLYNRVLSLSALDQSPLMLQKRE
ncbi:glycosyl transferase [Limnohabitans sp. JirII-31]|nr:glycosyltransferase [Limnohabitans sp. JirII-31]PIT74740.1 glycosyl transferase [Limnohabitans sp. JirII-31]